MQRWVERVLALVAVVLTGVFLAGVVGQGKASHAEGSRRLLDGPYFHAGKTPPVPVEDRGCRSPGCHAGMPHVKDRTQAAFRNMHLGFLSCLVCHGKAPRSSWTAEPPPPAPNRPLGGTGYLRARWKIAVSMPAVDREDLHGTLGQALACRACHSEEGRKEIAEKGVRDLPAGFANPVALRMIEEGAKRWIPDTMR